MANKSRAAGANDKHLPANEPLSERNSAQRPPPRSGPRRRASRRKKAPHTPPHAALYSTTTFRSQLEARWAIFFDMLAIDWDHEPGHYRVGEALGYVPDFYLPGRGLWVEVKGPPYLDRRAMGKIANAVAGPQPLPLREPPYWPNNGLLLLGPMLALPDIGRPVHTMLRAEAEDLVGAWRSVWTSDGVRLVGKRPWETFAASGTAPARRPSPARTTALLAPTAEPSTRMTAQVRQAYRVALATTFTEAGVAVLPDQHIVRRLEGRRSGRPVRRDGCTPLATDRRAA